MSDDSDNDSFLEDQECACHLGQLDVLANEYSKKAKKALQRKIPPKVILSQTDPYIVKFVKAARKEETSWIEWRAAKPLTGDQLLLKDPQARQRIMSA